MPPRSLSHLSDRSPVSVMRYSDDYSSCSSSEMRTSAKVKPQRKSLRFAEENNEVYEITHLDDIPEEEVAQIWYDAQEYAEIKSAYQLTIFMMEAGETLDSEEHTSRGLEYRTQEGAWARYENKRDAYNAVLDEQDRQWQRDEDDYDEIARIYLEHSAKCAEAAAQRGKEDEKAAMKVLASIIPPKKVKRKVSDKAVRRRGASEGSDKAQEILRERSSIRRSEIRDDIKRLEKKQSSSTKAPNRTISV